MSDTVEVAGPQGAKGGDAKVARRGAFGRACARCGRQRRVPRRLPGPGRPAAEPPRPPRRRRREAAAGRAGLAGDEAGGGSGEPAP
jgi:hypothetical protein